MMWDVILDEWVAMMDADSTWTTILGGKRLYPAQSARPVQVPSAEYSILWQREDELFWMMGVQVDLFAKTRQQMAQMESRLYALTHRDTSRIVAGVRTWRMFEEGREQEYPADRGVFHKSVDYTMKTLRSKYALAEQS